MSDIKTHRVVERPIGELVPYARNARTHTDAQVAQVAASIREFGFTSPVVIDEDGTILAGHARVLALRQLGVERVPCILASGLTEAQRRAYILADNRLALSAGWDDEMLRIEIGDLREQGFDLVLTGFAMSEIGRLDSVLDAPDAPEEFGEFNDEIETKHECPKCGYRW